MPRKLKSAPVFDPAFCGLRHVPIANRLGSHQTTMFYWGLYAPKYWRNYLHTHSFFEVCHVYRGRGIFRINGIVHKVKAGDLFIARPGDEHEIISDRRDGLGIHFWAYSIVRGRPDQNPSAGLSPVDALFDSFTQSCRCVAAAPASVAMALEMLTDEITRRAPGYPLVIEGLTAKLLLETARATVGEPVQAERLDPPVRNDTEAAVATASRYIRDNLSRPISLRDVAAQVHLSERHIGRLFLQVRQMTVLDYITQMRMESASQLLLNQHWPVKKVAAAAGYSDVRYFTTLFRKRMRMTPAAFRNQGGTVFSKPKNRN